MNGSSGDIGELPNVNTEPAEAESYSMSGSSSGSSGLTSDVVPHSGINYVSTEQKELITRLGNLQDECELPDQEMISRMMNILLVNEHPSNRKLRQIFEIAILNMGVLAQFAKNLPGFDELRHEDRFTLLTAGPNEIMILKILRKYDYQTDSIMFANNQPHSRDSYTPAGVGNIIDDLLYFGQLMYSLKVDKTEYVLLKAVVIFSERPNLFDIEQVRKTQKIYLDALKAYVESRRPMGSGTFAKLLSVLAELRTFNNYNSEIGLNVKLRNRLIRQPLETFCDLITLHCRFFYNIRLLYRRSSDCSERLKSFVRSTNFMSLIGCDGILPLDHRRLLVETACIKQVLGDHA